jgi:hypothetical protein
MMHAGAGLMTHRFVQTRERGGATEGRHGCTGGGSGAGLWHGA